MTIDVQKIAPELCDRVELYKKRTPIFDEYKIEEEIERILRNRYWLQNLFCLSVEIFFFVVFFLCVCLRACLWEEGMGTWVWLGDLIWTKKLIKQNFDFSSFVLELIMKIRSTEAYNRIISTEDYYSSLIPPHVTCTIYMYKTWHAHLRIIF